MVVPHSGLSICHAFNLLLRRHVYDFWQEVEKKSEDIYASVLQELARKATQLFHRF
jgi:hypothetical protein